MNASPEIFRAYDIRGIANRELTTEIAVRVGMSYGTYLNRNNIHGRVSIGRDIRLSSPHLERAVASGLASTGYNVEMIGLVPIPVANYWTWKNDFCGGVYITASHNPAEYNGIRFRHGDGTGYTEGNVKIKDIFFGDEIHTPSWDEFGEITRIESERVLEKYQKFILPKFSKIDGMKIAIDPGNGAAAGVASTLFEKMGAKVRTINDEPDGRFPNRPSEPSAKNLKDLSIMIKKGDFDFGIGFDGDADRCVFVDDNGEVVKTEKSGLIMVKNILKKTKGPVLVGVPCSKIVEEELKKEGAEVIWIRVGDVFVCELLKKHDAVFAMENSAHFFAPTLTEYLFDDPFVMSLSLAEIVFKCGKNLSDLTKEMKEYPYEEIKFECPDEIKFKINDSLQAKFIEEGYRVETIDGVKIWLENGWVLLRPSNTQPVIRMFVEANSEYELEEIKDRFTKELKEVMKSYLEE